MRPLCDDIVDFIRHNFDARDIPKVLELLQHEDGALGTPRVQRAVLYLSGGSLAMLRHYATIATTDVREVLLRAEYVLDVATAPMAVRNMAETFPPASSTDAASSDGAITASPRAPAPRPPRPPTRAGKKPAGAATGLHRQLVNRRFRLGDVDYLVSRDQPNRDRVRCLRYRGNLVSMSVVQLPLAFVLEQLTDEVIELHTE